MYSKKIKSSSHRKEEGVAIIIVLSFVVLLTGLVVAFLSRSLTEQQVSISGVAQVRADLLAQSALDTITGDLKQEIVLGSTTQAVLSGTGNVYIPLSGTTMLPQRSSGLTSGTLHNLVRVSSTAAVPSPGASTRASAVSSTTPSLNNRSVSVARWNSHYLVPLQGGSTSTAFPAPTWVYVTGTGPAVITTGTNTVIGRYAYAIYDEGGLLDINFVGYPAGSANAPMKVNAAYADLSQLSPAGALSGSAINNLIGWRNSVSAAASGTFGGNYSVNATAYHEHLTTATNGFMTVEVGPGKSDQSFTSRQALIRYWKNPKINLPLDMLQYFGTHSRDWNFASYTPPTGRPTVSSADRNDGHNQDDVINPSFARYLVSGTFTRLDGTEAQIGEPLVKRFPLSRLGTLTSGSNRSLGLNGGSNAYSYQDHEGINTRIKTLGDVALLNREPNFFELLKAAITAGAVTRAATGTGTPYDTYANTMDRRIDYAIIQIGANMIDQYDSDSFPTAITFDGKTFRGVEDLPYLFRVRQTVVKTALPDPVATTGGTTAPATVSGSNLTSTGVGVVLLQPEIWNPHLASGSPGNGPEEFAFIVDPNNAGTSGGTTSVTSVVSIAPTGNNSTSPPEEIRLPGFVNPGGALTPLNGSRIEFSGTNATLFREPVVLNQAGISDATMISTSDGSDFSLPVSATDSGSYIGVYVGAAPLRWIVSTGTSDEIFSAQTIEVRSSADAGITYRLAYKSGTNWVVYDEKVGPSAFGAQSIAWVNDASDTHGLTTEIRTWVTSVDPRTARFGMSGGYQVSGTAPVANQASSNVVPAGAKGLPTVGGWTGASPFSAHLLAINRSDSATRYEDADGTVRRAMGATGVTPVGASSVNRPVILNRPFRSLADLGHVFSGLPWKNLDLSFPESGFAALLDVFTINEINSVNGLVAGKVNLNTRQSEVLKAILSGALLDDPVASNPTTSLTVSGSIASGIRTQTSGTMQLKSLRDVVGDYVGSNTFDGLSPIIASGLGADANFARRRDAIVGALVNAGQTRVWNLFIDIIAQPGRFGNNASLAQFTVEGEQRLWVHLAIDRYTGKVLDRTIEVVKE